MEDYIDCSYNISKLIYDEEIKSLVFHAEIGDCVFNEINGIISITGVYNHKFSIDGLYQLDDLKDIEIQNSFDMPIDFSMFKKLVDLEIPWNPFLKFENSGSLKWLHLRKYGKEKFELDVPLNLEYLLLTQGKLKNISGIEKTRSLKALEISYLPKMEDYTAIGKLKHLEYLRITNCGKVGNIDFIKSLKNLKWVCFSGCKEIETLKPLVSLKKLEGIHLTGTKILDNDKSIVKEKSNYKAYPYLRIIQRLYKDI